MQKKNNSGSTGIRRKTYNAIKLVADATMEGSERLLAGIKEINDTEKQMKTKEIEMEMRIHQEEMQYGQIKDEKILENARLSLQNQGAVVAAMASLADATRGSKAPVPSRGAMEEAPQGTPWPLEAPHS
jgi:hypothetical protein